MAHTFRLYTAGGSDNIEGWGDSNGYGTKAINSINDPEGATYKREITSIPSPFARIDLMKSAFKQVVESEDMDNQQTIYHKLVSDCFDVAEIFFNIEKLREKFDIITWSKKDSLALLTGSKNPSHRQLGDTLSMYLDQDAKSYNFDSLQNIYLLNYKGIGAPAQVNIIGATSPATLFFTSSNDLSYVSKTVCFGNDRPFDTGFQPLYKRDTKFILYWFGLKNLWNQLQGYTDKSFSNLFKEVDDYLNLTYAKLTQEQKDAINQMTIADMNGYQSIPITSKTDLVEVLGCELKCLNINSTFRTDFMIDSDFTIEGKKPLVLPIDNFRKPLVYTQDLWDNKTIVPVYDKNALLKRKLPNDGRIYPYLTIGDFLEDNIICNESPFNDACFYNGGDKECLDEYSYLLPIKKEYFQYFSIADLKKNLSIERCSVSNDKVVKISLRIPIKGHTGEINYIYYERFYYENQVVSSDSRDGKIVVKRFALHLFPFLKVKDGITADYRINIIDLQSDNNKFDVICYKNGKAIDKGVCIKRNETEEGDIINSYEASPQTFVCKNSFNRINLIINGISNYIIPEFKGNTGANTFDFAVDFGTSNTHIEYRIDGKKIETFSINENECLIQPLNKDYPDVVMKSILADFLPACIGKSYKFPTRTVLSEKVDVNWNTRIYPLAATNLPFVFETMSLPKYNKIHTDLKWASDAKSMSRIQSYLENLFILMRYKVLVNGGNLETTKVIWFYPASMSLTRVAEIRKIWKYLYENYFGSNSAIQIITMSESVAPYYFYKQENKATTNVVSVDIGGGTSDILLVKDGVPQYLSSCRFAANSIFDSQPCHSNPFVNKYIKKLEQILSDNFIEDIAVLAENMRDSGNVASDIVMLFFSLVNNEEVKKQNIANKVDYNAILFKDAKLKVLFILFYTALVYHIARIMKAKDLEFPRHLTFSGTGSKILQILVDIQDKVTLESYTKLIFEKVYGIPYNKDGLGILINIANPKEATCKGGLIQMQNENVSNVDEMKVCLLGTNDARFAQPSTKYKDIDQQTIDKIIDEVRDFTKLFYELDREFSFERKFGTMKTKELEDLKECFIRDISKYIKDGINEKDSQDEIEETLFFYPIKGILSAISGKL